MKNDVTGTDRRPEKYQLLPELPPEQFQALKADIAERGVIVAVLVDEFGAILDGHNRARACRELGINDYPVEVRSGLTEAEKRALARNLNALRRHLTREQVRSLIADQLRDTPEWSNRRVAGGLGVDDKTVASVRMGLMATAEFPQLDKTVGADGKARRAPPKRRRKSHSAPLADDELFLDDEGDDTDEAVAADPKQDKARRREEREQRRADKGYNMFANCTEEEKREWHVFLLFLVKHEGALVDGGVAEHVEGQVSFTDCEASLSSLRRISAKRSGTPSAMISAYIRRSCLPITAMLAASSLPIVAIFGSIARRFLDNSGGRIPRVKTAKYRKFPRNYTQAMLVSIRFATSPQHSIEVTFRSR